MTEPNIDPHTVAGFGREWQTFDQLDMSPEELEEVFGAYFRLFPWEELPPNSRGFDAGCGSGRWAKLVAPRVAELHAVDASAEALDVARRALAGTPNVVFHHADINKLPFDDASMDFGYSLGVLHHLPNTAAGLRACASKLRPRAPFLVYLYYALDNRPIWFRSLWRCTDLVRRAMSRAPHPVKVLLTGAIAAGVYLPLSRMARLAERRGRSVEAIPLSYYRHRSFYTMRTDALDRFGTRLEKRFRREQIAAMMRDAGLEDIRFSHEPPYWCALGYKAPT